MTILEYAIARQAGRLTEAAKTRPLTAKETRFLERTRTLVERLRTKEGK
jgi:hypothetical protein